MISHTEIISEILAGAKKELEETNEIRPVFLLGHYKNDSYELGVMPLPNAMLETTKTKDILRLAALKVIEEIQPDFFVSVMDTWVAMDAIKEGSTPEQIEALKRKYPDVKSRPDKMDAIVVGFETYNTQFMQTVIYKKDENSNYTYDDNGLIDTSKTKGIKGRFANFIYGTERKKSNEMKLVPGMPSVSKN
jgi:nitrogenase molybdenum-iron protein alpha/beta subunit